MKVLGIETATDVCSAALVTGPSVVVEEWVERKSAHAERLLPMIEQLLRGAGLAAADLDVVAVSIGPGSFTGLRIGLSVAKGLVFATGARMVAVPTLEALAARVTAETLPGERVFALLDARREEVYCQLFDVAGGRAVACGEPRDATLTQLPALAGDGPLLLTGEARGKAHAALAAAGRRIRIASSTLGRNSAVPVAILGRERVQRGEEDDPSLLEPRYIKDFFLRSGTFTPGV
jgi:tRNA threonylcarbamoyladenosine biosynthesis protein TsaB